MGAEKRMQELEKVAAQKLLRKMSRQVDHDARRESLTV